MITAALEGFYSIPEVKAFKYRSKFQILRLEFPPCVSFCQFLTKYSTDSVKMKGLIRCFFTGNLWFLEIDTSIIQIAIETSEE